ncbi:hypothetical protein MANES_17G102333v8 [Manihot esculenta]|uniref:Uncharacterized protein n=1 Tax=Manihot esculenta TaxID=3983 RepID=A0ACB7G597_MANES|nr:hypothetical protein MANES_17G102333v8 [Manihot esculenta]
MITDPYPTQPHQPRIALLAYCESSSCLRQRRNRSEKNGFSNYNSQSYTQ